MPVAARLSPSPLDAAYRRLARVPGVRMSRSPEAPPTGQQGPAPAGFAVEVLPHDTVQEPKDMILLVHGNSSVRGILELLAHGNSWVR